MRKIICAVCLSLITLIIIAIPVFAATYSATFTISETTGLTSYSMLPMIKGSPNQWMADNGFMKSTALDSRIETLGGDVKPHMVADNQTLTAIPVGISSQNNLYFTTGNTDLVTMDIITGYGGYVTTPDSPALELLTNGAVTLTNAYINTTAGASSIFSKQNAIQVIPDVTNSGQINITANTTRAALDFEMTNSDYVSIPDSNNFSFTNGGGVDTSFTITGWIKPEANTNIQEILSKMYTTATCEYAVRLSAAGEFGIFLEKIDATAYLAKFSVVQLPDNVWSHIAITYTGSKTVAGIKLFYNGNLLSNTSNTTSGVYPGMTNTNSLLEFGRFIGGGAASEYLDGMLSNFKIFKNRVLASSEVLEEYNGTFSSNTNLVGWYKFIDGAGNPVDSSGLGHNATANVADWVTTNFLLPLSASGITSGDKTLSLSANVTSGNLMLWSNGVAIASGSLFGGTIVNSTKSWKFGNNLPYCDSITITVNGTRQLYYAPNTMIIGTTLPDREATGGLQNGVITWGSNPAGVSIELGPLMGEESAPSFVDDPDTQDVLPGVKSSDWYTSPDIGVGGSLLTNPLRPFVLILSDTTTLTERQAWVLLGIAFVLLVLVITAKTVHGHHIITGIATGAAIGLCVVQTIFPFYSIIFIIASIFVGAVAERSQSL